jgi:hypothetical protein
MKPLQVAARFTAFVWYVRNRQTGDAGIQEDARKFAQKNWRVFLPMADKGLGKLLLRIAKMPSARPQAAAQPRHYQSSGQQLAATA